MVEGPGGIFMCVQCVDAAERIVADLRRRGVVPPAKLPASD